MAGYELKKEEDKVENTEIIEEEKKPQKRRKLLIIVMVVAFLIAGWLLFVCSIRHTFGGYTVDGENAVAKQLLNASGCQVEDYYKAMGGSVPADKEYYVRYHRGKEGYVNESCELLPESAVNKYYSGKSCYAVVKFKNGKAVEAWQSGYHELADDELHYYDRHWQQEEFNKHLLKGVRVVIGYYNAEQGDTFIH